MIPTQTEIVHFMEVYSTRHFTRAATKLGIAQPSLTQSILKLESKLKVKLFHRTKQGCVSTLSGDLFHEKARRLSELWTEVSESVSATRSALSGVFRVGCHVSVATYTLPNFLKTLSETAPQLEVRVHHDWSRRVTEKVITHELDLGFVVNPVRHRDLVLIKLGADRVAFWKKTGFKPPDRIFADTNMIQSQSLLAARNSARFRNYQIIDTSSLELIRTLVAQGAGIGILPERVATAEKVPIEIVDEDLPTFRDSIYAAYHVGSLETVAGRALIAAARKSLTN